MAIAIGYFINAFICMYLNAHYNKVLKNYGFFEQMLDIFLTILGVTVMFSVVYIVGFGGLNDIVTILIQFF